MPSKPLALFLIILPLLFNSVTAEERAHTEAEQAALAAGADLVEVEAPRPANLPDFTKGDPPPAGGKNGPITWNLGATGIIGIKNSGMDGDQILVVAILPGSPAVGKIAPGDVLLGIQNKRFKAGGNLGYLIGNAIIKAEEEAGGGIVKFRVWRDLNFAKRSAGKDIAGIDIDKVFKDAEATEVMQDWNDTPPPSKPVVTANYADFPIIPEEFDTTLQLQVMGTYTDTSPWDCPVADKIRENAWRYLEKRFVASADGRSRPQANTLDAVALVASGRPEHRELVKSWVHNHYARDWSPDRKVPLSGAMLSWHMGFGGLDAAIYYDATGDDYVVPALREIAVKTAMGQNGGGSWGHTFASPSFNGGKLHMREPGYGGMNNAGSRCFFLLALARKNGISHPEIDDAIGRADRFYRTYVDKGAVPYGFHGPAGTDDSNGKNYGAAYAFHVLGDHHAAKYFGQLSTHASFTRRGGHASPTLWYYTPMSGAIAGPEGVRLAMRNMRWFYTLARRHDGSFVLQGEQAGIGGNPSISPTATHALFYSHPFKQTVITGKYATEAEWHTPRELDHLLISARSQLNDPLLLARAGKPWPERSSKELVELLDMFFPVARHAIAKELADRIKKGESELLPVITARLAHQNPRVRDAALRTLTGVGEDAVLAAMSKILPMLNDPAEYVRMAAIHTLSAATGYDPNERSRLLLDAAARSYEGMTMDHGNVRSAVSGALFPRGKASEIMITAPFTAGIPEATVRQGLKELITMDPGGYVSGKWDRDTTIRLAGPLSFAADFIQLNDAMFGFARTGGSRDLFIKHGFIEGLEGDAALLMERQRLRRDVRTATTMTHEGRKPILNVGYIRTHRGTCRAHLPGALQMLLDNPVYTVMEITPQWTINQVRMASIVTLIESDKNPKIMSSVAPEVATRFKSEMIAAGDAKAQIAFCRAELADPRRRWIFRQMAAMYNLGELVGGEVIDDLFPYLGMDDRRLRETSHRLAVAAAKAGAANRLSERMLTTDAPTVQIAGALNVLAEAGTGADAARRLLDHPAPGVRRAAVEAVSALDTANGLATTIEILQKSSDRDVLWGCENALLARSRGTDAAQGQKIVAALVPMLPTCGIEQLEVVSFVLAQIGGAKALDPLQAAAITGSGDQQRAIVTALSYGPERGIDNRLITLAKADPELATIVAAQATRRLVIGPKGINDVTDQERVAFARQMLAICYHPHIVSYLATVRTGPAVALLFDVMKERAPALAPLIIENTEGMDKPTAEDAKIAGEVLTQVIEFIEVTQLRGGVDGKTLAYPAWKALQQRAGKALLRLAPPTATTIPIFDSSDINF